MAILLAVSASDKIKIEALTTVDGNTDIDHATQNASAILKLCGGRTYLFIEEEG